MKNWAFDKSMYDVLVAIGNVYSATDVYVCLKKINTDNFFNSIEFCSELKRSEFLYDNERIIYDGLLTIHIIDGELPAGIVCSKYSVLFNFLRKGQEISIYTK